MTLVEAREINPPANEEPLHWRLLTTIEVGDAAAACEIVRLYRLRWRIEEVFRALKSDGMRLEETQVHEAGRLFKLAVVGLAAACRTIQLVDARDGSPRPATDVIDPTLLPAAEAIGRDTGRQNRTPEKPPSAAFSCMAGLDHCKTWWVELLLQTARTQDYESRMGTIRNHDRRVHHRNSPRSEVKSENPVGVIGRQDHGAPVAVDTLLV